LLGQLCRVLGSWFSVLATAYSLRSPASSACLTRGCLAAVSWFFRPSRQRWSRSIVPVANAYSRTALAISKSKTLPTLPSPSDDVITSWRHSSVRCPLSFVNCLYFVDELNWFDYFDAIVVRHFSQILIVCRQKTIAMSTSDNGLHCSAGQ
jgi:hypothetical protein